MMRRGGRHVSISHLVPGAAFHIKGFHHDSSRCRSESAPPAIAGGSRGLFRWVCTSNPFYVLSALLVCLGLWVSFGSQVDASQTWALLFGMAGYTLLLAVTACLLVRFVGVWDDVRTVLLLVVLMFLATSVTFDEVLASNPTRGVACYLGGLLFAVAVSEGMLRGFACACRRSSACRTTLILALFFLYPVAITPLLDSPRSEALFWALFGFSPAAGLVFLTLLPADPSRPRLRPRQRQPVGLGVVSLDPVRGARLRGRGSVRLALLVDAPRPVCRDRAVHLRALFPRAVRAGDRRAPAGDRAGRAAEGRRSGACSCPRSWSS